MKSNYKIYLLTGIVVLFSTGIINFYSFQSSFMQLIIIILIPILYQLNHNPYFFVGRFSLKSYPKRDAPIFVLILSFLLCYLIFLPPLDAIEFDRNMKIANFIMAQIVGCIYFSAFILILLLTYRKWQDMNLPGYYFILSILPIFSWFIGVKVFKSKFRVLGVLVFFNSIIAIPFILLWPGNPGSNYFGVDPKMKRDFDKEKKNLIKNSFLTSAEKTGMLKLLCQKYQELEYENFLKYRTTEITKYQVAETQKLEVSLKNIIKTDIEHAEYINRISQFYTNYVDDKLNKYYQFTSWS